MQVDQGRYQLDSRNHGPERHSRSRSRESPLPACLQGQHGADENGNDRPLGVSGKEEYRDGCCSCNHAEAPPFPGSADSRDSPRRRRGTIQVLNDRSHTQHVSGKPVSQSRHSRGPRGQSEDPCQNRASDGGEGGIDENGDIQSCMGEQKRGQEGNRMQYPMHHLCEKRDAEGLMGVPEGELEIPQSLNDQGTQRLEEFCSVPPDQRVAACKNDQAR